MTALNRKLARDLWHTRGQAVAIMLVIASGVATFVMSVNTLISLQRTQQQYYDHYRFADVFAHLKRAPNALKQRLAEIPGVAQVQTRVVASVTLNVEGLSEPAVGRLVSISERREPSLNDLYLRRGRFPDPGRAGEVLVSEGFLEANNLKPGDTIDAVLNGRLEPLRIVGVALSPEFIYQIREGEVLPDDKRYAVLWMHDDQLAAAFDMEGAFNNVTLSLLPGTSEPEVIERVDDLLADYGGTGAYGRDDQPSHEFVSNEIKELRGMALFVPAIFLAVAAFLLNVVLSRQINTQREQIAALKAFGYLRLEIGAHYLKLVLLIVLAGVVIGSLLGAWFGAEVTQAYTQFFRFPVFAFHLDPRVIVLAAAISMAAGVGGTMASVRRAMKLPPAEAMRPEPPRTYRPTVLERWGLQRLFSPATRMIVRHLERRPFKSALTCVGIGLAVAVLILGNFMVDALDYVMESQFEVAQRHDVSVMFNELTESAVLHDVENLPGVMTAEPFRALPVRVRREHRQRRLAVMGIEPDGRLFRLIDIHRNPVVLPPHGLVMSQKLAELLHVRVGDEVTLEVLEGERPVRRVPVVGLIADFTGVAAYMDRRALNRVMREGDNVSGAYVAVEPGESDALYTELKRTPHVAAVTLKDAALRSFRDTIAENLLRMRLFNVIFACIIAVGVVYNAARISLAERSRELATLRVIGFTRAEISLILLGELAVLTLISIPLGLALGHGLAALLVNTAYDSELFRIPLVIRPATYGFAAVVVLGATVVSGLIVRRRLDRLDLVEVLKSRE